LPQKESLPDAISSEQDGIPGDNEHGERERLLTELSELRNQLLAHLQEKITFSLKMKMRTLMPHTS